MLREYDVNISSEFTPPGDDLVFVLPESLYLEMLARDYADRDALTGHLNASHVNRSTRLLSPHVHTRKGFVKRFHGGCSSEPVSSLVMLAL